MLPKANELRNEIPALKNCVYLNTAGSGPSPQPVLDNIVNTYKYMAEKGNVAIPVLEKIRKNCEYTRELLSEIVGANSNEIAFLRSIAEGINMIALSYNWEKEDEVIITDEENPAGIMPWLNLVKLKGIKIKKLNIVNNKKLMINRLENLINNKTKFIFISHVTHVRGIRLPIKEITYLAHNNNILVMIDGAQAVGQIPLNLKEIDCDFYLISGHKWLLGPNGTCGLYMNKRHFYKVDPPFLGKGSETTFDFEKDLFELHKDAKMYEFGGRHWPLYQALGKAIEFTKKIGVLNIEKRAAELADFLREMLSQFSRIHIISPEDNTLSTGIFSFSVNGVDAKKLVDMFWKKKKILIQWRTFNLLNHSKGVRISLAWFNEKEDLEQLANYLKEIIN